MLVQRIRRIISALAEGLLEREEVLRLTLLAALAGENTFLYGPPGVAKSLLARRVAYAFQDAETFEYLLGKFTTPEELFGPVSISRLKNDDRFERVLDGYLPSATIVFLDEIWNASSPILNTLLTAVNERRFRNGTEELQLPLQTVIGAAGSLKPEEPGLINLWDRFLLRLHVRSVQDAEAFIELIESTDDLYNDTIPAEDKITPDELDEWSDAREAIVIPPDILALIVDIRERIARHNSINAVEDGRAILVSDRRWKQAARLLRTSALLNGRERVDALDCVILRHCLWSDERDIDVVNTIIEEALRRYTTSGRFDPEPLRSRLDQELARLRGATVAVHEEHALEPVEYRGEYYRVADFVDDHLALLWIGDFQSLSTEHSAQTDLFFYNADDEFAYSDQLPMRRTGELSVEIAGQEFAIETRQVHRAMETEVEIDEATRDQINTELDTLKADVRGILEEISGFGRVTETAAAEHLFVHRSYAAIIGRGMADAESVFSLLDTDINAALALVNRTAGDAE
jgi:MoxR-like ATPase